MSPLRVQMDGLSDLLRGMSPALVRQFMPLLDQLMPMYLDLANGRQEFIPGQQETRVLVRGCYGGPWLSTPTSLLLQTFWAAMLHVRAMSWGGSGRLGRC